jgi:ligand-binding sensor domain-containing protein/signal transduction histidine kinase
MLVLLGGGSQPVLALDPARTLAQYLREHWHSEHGFPGGSVTAIAQTSDGYLWIGSERGLVRFDGRNFRSYPQATPLAFPIGAVRALVADSNNNLWVILQSTKVLRYQDGRFEVGRDAAEFAVTATGNDKDGSVLFASLALGILTYRSGKYEEVASGGDESNNGGIFADDLSTRNSWATGILPHKIAAPNSEVLAIAQSADGTLWIGTSDKGLFFKQGEHILPAVTSGLTLHGVKINCLLPLQNHELWIGTDQGVWRYTGSEITSEGVPAALRRGTVNSMLRDADSNIWLGTSTGLARVKPDGVTVDSERAEENLPVTALFEDREHNVWIGNPLGIERLRDSAFVTYRAPTTESDANGPVFLDRPLRVWYAPLDGGLHWMRNGLGGAVTNDGLDKDVIYTIDQGADGEIWVGRQRGGLTRLRIAGDDAHPTVRAQTFTEANGLAQNGVYAVHRGSDGAVWAGTLSGGLSKFKYGRFTNYTVNDGLPSNTVVSITEAAGAIWVATPNGVTSLRDGKWRLFGARQGLPDENTNCLFADSSGTLWIGTAAGLAYLREDQVHVPDNTPEALQEQILGIAEDRQGWLWISTSHHVLRLRRDAFLNNTLTEADVHEYGIEDGLHGIEGVKRQRSVVIGPVGRIWFSMNRGISSVDPSRALNAAPAIVRVESVSVDGSEMNFPHAVSLIGARRRVTFNFQALSLSVPNRIRFRYKLENNDDGWSSPTTTREVSYNNLPAGSYVFRLVASNSDGIWNSSEVVVPMTIAPFYYQTWWFRIGVAALCVVAVLMLVRVRLRAIQTQMNMRFEERLVERNRIAQELHDTLLQGMLSASMQLHVADEQLPEGSAAKPLVGRVLELMNRAIIEGRNTVRGLRSPDAMRLRMEDTFAQIHKDLAISPHAGFRVIVEGASRRLRPAIHDDIYFIGREALSNAFRHSGATEFEVEVEYATGFFRLLVRDNGKGIDPLVLRTGRDGHWGLAGMRERTDRIGARLRLLSRAAAGTEVELSVPARLAYETDSTRRGGSWFAKLYPRRDREAEEEKREVEVEGPRS